ncbi:MAG: phytoene/squalene synthase family protein, partial [Ktedonobacterales bacterium]
FSSGDVSMPAEGDISSDTSSRVRRDSTCAAGKHSLSALTPYTERMDHASAYVQAPEDAEGQVAIDEAYRYCRGVARQIARTFYYGSLFLPREKRRASWALYAFCRTADDIADEPALYPQPAAELDRWRAALLATYAGNPRGPVMTAWADMLAMYAVPMQPALDLLDGVAMDVRGHDYQTFDDLRLYCYRVAGTVGLLMSPILGYATPEALGAAVDLGIAMQLTNILRDIGEDLGAGRVYLPAEDMDRFGYTHEELRAGVINPAFVALMEFEMARAEDYYRSGMRGIRLLNADSRLAIALSGTLYHNILRRIRRNCYDVFTRRAHISLPGKLATLPAVWLSTRLA